MTTISFIENDGRTHELACRAVDDGDWHEVDEEDLERAGYTPIGRIPYGPEYLVAKAKLNDIRRVVMSTDNPTAKLARIATILK